MPKKKRPLAPGDRDREKTTTPGVYKVTRGTTKGDTVRYEVLHRMSGKLVSEGTYESYADACAVIRRVRARVDDETYIPRRAGQTTWGEVAEKWLAKKAGLKPRTQTGYRALLDGRCAEFKPVPIGRMTYDRISSWVAAMQEEGLTASTVRNAFTAVKGVMDEAVKLRLIKTNPCHDVDKPSVKMPESYELQPAEVEAIIVRVTEDAGERWGLLVALAAYSGLRSGELASLRVKRLNLTAGTLEAWDAATFGLDGKLAVTTTKVRRRRTVRELAPSLRLTLARYIESEGLSQEDFLFGWKDSLGASHMYRHGNFYRRIFLPAVRAVGLPVMDDRPGDPGVRFHDLRHYRAAMLLADPETTLKDAQAEMGHTTLALLADRYAHLLAASGKGRGTRTDALRTTAQAEVADRASGANVSHLPTSKPA